jgi:hypothetical protein
LKSKENVPKRIKAPSVIPTETDINLIKPLFYAYLHYIDYIKLKSLKSNLSKQHKYRNTTKLPKSWHIGFGNGLNRYITSQSHKFSDNLQFNLISPKAFNKKVLKMFDGENYLESYKSNKDQIDIQNQVPNPFLNNTENVIETAETLDNQPDLEISLPVSTLKTEFFTSSIKPTWRQIHSLYQLDVEIAQDDRLQVIKEAQSKTTDLANGISYMIELISQKITHGAINLVSNLRNTPSLQTTFDILDIDLVITWVNPNDPFWIQMKNHHTPEIATGTGHSNRRWTYSRELILTLKAYLTNAPWFRKIFLVVQSESQIKNMDKETHDSISSISKLVIVYHHQFMDYNCLPTFNSMAIEANLHRIEGLSEYFVYSNDDTFLSQPIAKHQLFDDNFVDENNPIPRVFSY